MASFLTEIYKRSQKCQNLFQKCTSLAEADSLDWFECRQADFHLWASSVQALRTGRSSFDYRLRERPDVYGAVCDLLEGLAETLERHFNKADPGYRPDVSDMDRSSSEDRKDDIELSFSDFSDESSASYASSDASNEAISPYASSIVMILEQLIRLSNAIRRSASKIRYEKADSKLKIEDYRDFQDFLNFSIKKQRWSRSDTALTSAQWVEQLQQEPLSSVQQRLIRANIMRRNRIDFTMKSKPSLTSHAPESLAHNSSSAGEPATLAVKPRTTSVTNFSKANSGTGEAKKKAETPQSVSILQTATEIGSQFDFEAAVAKQTTATAPSVVTRATHIGINQPYPRCPTYYPGATIKCPYCAEPLPKQYASDTSMWRGHVANDLLPYTCIHENCTIPYTLYSTSHELMAHMHDQHACDYWVCTLCYLKPIQPYNFRTVEEWEHHMQTLHENEMPSTQLSAFKETSKRRGIQHVFCPLCAETDDQFEFNFEHIASHVHSFAITSLTWETGQETDCSSAHYSLNDTEFSDLANEKPFDDFGLFQAHYPELRSNVSSYSALLGNNRFQQCIADTRDDLDKLSEVLSITPFTEQGFFSMTQFRREAKKLSKFQPSVTYKISLVGDSGVGKSSLVNSLLNKPNLSRAGNSGMACTVVATEYHYHDSDDYFIEVEWLSHDDIATLLRECLFYYRRYTEWNNDATDEEKDYLQTMYNLAYDVFTSILGSGWQNNPEICLTNDQAALEALEAAGRSLMSGNKEHPLAFTSVEALSERLRDMNSSGLHSETPTLCYLLKKIKVFIKASVLCHGVVLADLPGLGDVNAVRRNCTERYLLESQEILAVCSIGRAATDSSVQDIFYLAKQAELHNVNIVTTKCDDLLLEEFEIDVKGTPKTEFRQMVKDKVNAEVQLKISEEKVRSFLSETEELTAHESSRLVKANIESLESRKQLEKTEADLENFMVTTRNSATVKVLRRLYSEMILDNDLHIFPVSSRYYKKAISRRNRGPNDAQLGLSGILALQRHCMWGAAVDLSNELHQYMTMDVASVLTSLVAWTKSTMDSCRAHLDNRDEAMGARQLQCDINLLDKELRRAALASSNLLHQLFNEYITPALKVYEWHKAATSVMNNLRQWHPLTFLAFCRRFGLWSTRAVGFCDWNAEFSKAMVDDLVGPSQQLFEALRAEKEKLHKAIADTLVSYGCQKDNTLADAETTQTVPDDKYDGAYLLRDVDKAFEAAILNVMKLGTDVFSGIRTSYIGRALEPFYRRANSEYGPGSHRSRFSIISSAFKDEKIFDDIIVAFGSSYVEIIEESQDKISEALQRHRASTKLKAAAHAREDEEAVLRSQLKFGTYLLNRASQLELGVDSRNKEIEELANELKLTVPWNTRINKAKEKITK